MSAVSFVLMCLSITNSIGVAQIMDKITIDTSLGPIIGNIRTDNATNVKIYEFAGIRYAVPPIGHLRFRPSVMNENWGNQTYNATSFGDICVQPGNSIDQSEDCLFLNIWSTSAQSNANLPVFVWIHGGAYIGGSGSDPLYNAHNMVSFSENIVVVTLNYRLGAFGFLSNQQIYDEDPVNYPSSGGMNGVLDQIHALQWIRKYIKSFGGDPNQVTIFGESAGGYSVCNLLISPLLKEEALFKRALIESGSCTGPWTPIMEQLAIDKCNAVLLDNFHTINITKLRAIEAKEFKYAWCLPTAAVDGYVMPELPALLWQNLTENKLNANEWIIGFNSMDGDIAFSDVNVPKTAMEYHDWLTDFIPDNATQVRLLETVYYPLSDYPAYEIYPSAAIAWSTINGDCCVSCPSMKDMKESYAQFNEGSMRGYVYEFRGGGYPYYANHASELAFVWDQKDEENPQIVWNQKLSNSMMSAWTNFAKYGIPNINNTQNNVEIEWNEFGNNANVLILDDTIRVQSNYYKEFRHDVCDFWFNEVGMEKIIRFCCIDRQC